ncbi:methyltransferase domain-containing protein [Haloferula sp. A504]|uniref:methyltransferase domain-containing protein n=1 Tax=Haloferula sp. A504 TaxID=3373601 RepID=UPI0031CB2F18|nr:TPMT family class I SAM-dependent methyltransferase [Verrucomicrobiaceae bacterium E54]
MNDCCAVSRNWEDHWMAGDTPWDKGEAAPPLLEYLDEWDDGFVDGARILVPGCGSGHDVRALAAAGARVTGLDLSPTAVEVARSHPAINGEAYVQGDLFDWSDDSSFDAVWEHTCFCAIEPEDRSRYAEAVARWIRPGGRLIGVFYLDPDNPDGSPPHPSSKAEIERHLAPSFSLERGKVPDRAFPSRLGREWLAQFVRHG